MLRRPRSSFAAVLIAAVLVSGAAVALGVGPATVGQPAERLDVPSRTLVTSDSAWLGIKTYGAVDAVQGFDHQLVLASCRRRVSTSCRNYDGSVPPTSYAEVARRGDTFDTLVQAAGYDDSDHDFVSDLTRTIDLTRQHGYRRVVWVTLRENVSYDSTGHIGYGAVYERNNDALREIAATGLYPELIVADFAEYARHRPEWFAADGIHIRRLGAYAAADYLSRKMAFLDGRACPQPVAPGAAAQDPCPDPDVTGPIADVAALYPTTQAGPDSGLILVWEGASSWPAPPWWER